MRRTPSLALSVLLLVGSFAGLVGPASAAPKAAATTAPAPTSSKAKPYADEGFVIKGDIGDGVRTVTLQRRTSGWKNGQSVQTKADGTYSFTTHTSAAKVELRVVAKKTDTLPEIDSGVITITTRTDSVRLVLSRNRTVGIARGTAKVSNEGRLWALQVHDGSWKAVGAKLTEGKDGAIVSAFPLKKGSYRLVGDPVAKTWDGKPLAGARSSAKSLSTGPKSLGKHVLFLSTDSGGTPTKKGKDYTGRVGLDNDPTLVVDEIAVRGNTSVGLPKKSYKLQFADSVTPFGLPRGKHFVLNPNFQDHALVRNAVATELARELDGLRWTPHRVFTEVFLNGSYRGSYELIESIRIQEKGKKNDARVAIDAKTGVIMEIGPGSPGDVFYKGQKGVLFGFKDPDKGKLVDGKPDPEGLTAAKKAGMKTKIKKFESVVYGKDYTDPVKGWQKYLDMDSAVDFYLENEFIKNWDGDFFRSTFFYTDDYRDANAKLFMGPIWDEDRTAGDRTTGTNPISGPKGWWMNGDGHSHDTARGDVHKTHWFVRITKDKAFQKALKARWAEKRATFKAVSTTGIDTQVKALGKNVAANDRGKWQSTQPAARFLPRAKTYNGEVTYLKNWYKARYSWMNGKLD